MSMRKMREGVRLKGAAESYLSLSETFLRFGGNRFVMGERPIILKDVDRATYVRVVEIAIEKGLDPGEVITEALNRWVKFQGEPFHLKSRESLREEANAITCYAFRNGFLEELHAGNRSKLLEDKSLSRITDTEMKKLMVEASDVVAKLLALKETNPDAYWNQIEFCSRTYTKDWDKGDVSL